jgi:chlorite dismutase
MVPVTGGQPARLFTFAGGESGPWRIVRTATVAGQPLPEASRLAILTGDDAPDRVSWRLRGITSNERYVTRVEKADLVAKQEGLGRADCTCAALIPIRKTAAWWALPQDERRRIFEESSRHVRIGLKYLPAVARRLHHCRDLAQDEPFDFLTWFEYSPGDAAAFDALVAELRASEEWRWVEREVDIRVVRTAA